MHEPVLYAPALPSRLARTFPPAEERGKPDMIIVAIVVALGVAVAAVVGARRNQIAVTPERDDAR